jgi:hypothetical protein
MKVLFAAAILTSSRSIWLIFEFLLILDLQNQISLPMLVKSLNLEGRPYSFVKEIDARR